ncbi:MAG: hypothetical protein V1720_00525 [bacterium]
MKSATLTRTLKRAAAVTAAFTVFAMSSTFAQATQPQTKFNEKEIANLKIGIQSENEGLKRSAIYLAGKYALNDLVDVLVEQLKNENKAATRHLIALSLYKIGNAYGMEAVKETAMTDKDARIKRLAAAIYDEYVFENEHKYYSLNE